MRARLGADMQIPANWDVPQRMRERLGRKSVGRQRAMIDGGHLLLVLHKAPTDGSREREGVFFWRDPQGTWRGSEGNHGLRAVQDHVAGYETSEDHWARVYDGYTGHEELFHLLEALGPLQRSAKNMHAALQDAREGIPQDRDIVDLRDQAYDTHRGLELLYMDARNALDFAIARKAKAQARLGAESVAMEGRLNVLAAIFLPLTAIGGVFGMNLVHGLEQSPPWTFWLVFGCGLLLGLGVRSWVKRRDTPSS